MEAMKLIALVLVSLATLAYGSCPSRREIRKRQQSRLKSLNDNDIVVEATYKGKRQNLHRYEKIVYENLSCFKRACQQCTASN